MISDTFVLTFLYANRDALILHFHNKQNLDLGNKHAYQRWIKCIYQYTRNKMYPAHIAMYEQWRSTWDRTIGDFDRNEVDERADIPKSAENFVREAVDDFKVRFMKGNNFKLSVAIDVLNKIKDLKIVVSLPSTVFPIEKLDEFYEDLNLRGDENFLQSIWEINKNFRKIINEPRNSWRRQIDRMVYAQSNDWMTYNILDGNILCKL